MKKIFTILVCSIALLSMSCGSGQQKSTEQQEVDKSGPEYTSAYICPMHCEGSGSDEAGSCPVCGMDYVKNKNAEGHDEMHDDAHMDDHSDHMESEDENATDDGGSSGH